MDSIMASPTKKVLVKELRSSGCWAIAARACCIARPMPKAGPIEPMAIVKPAANIEAIRDDAYTIHKNSSFNKLFRLVSLLFLPLHEHDVLLRQRGRSYINHGKNRKNIGLNHAN